jgi:hypothetical protein
MRTVIAAIGLAAVVLLTAIAHATPDVGPENDGRSKLE